MTISRVYETSAIATYIDETFENPPLQPKNARDRARMHQWMSSVNSYYYTYMIYHVTHERLVFPRLGIASDEKVVAHALPKIEVGLQVLERQLAHGKAYLLGADLTLADFYLVPCTFSFSLTDEGKTMYPKYPGFCRWRETMEALPTVQTFSSFAAAARADRARAGSGPCRIARNIEGLGNVRNTHRAVVGSATCGGFFGQRRQLQHSAKPMPLLPTIGAIKADLWASRSKAGPFM